MWREEYAGACRVHPELVAVFESDRGRLALLLRHTLVPLFEEQEMWLDQTRRAARDVIGSLRGAGLCGRVLVLQWRPLGEVAHILRAWPCRFEADPARRVEIARVVNRMLDDRRFVNVRRAEVPDPRENVVRGRWRPALSLSGWYRDMAPCWLGAEPPVRRQLILRTHRWIVERVLLPLSRGADPVVGGLRPETGLEADGTLARALARSLPPAEIGAWQRWIGLVVADLDHALAWPRRRRTADWLRWLFLIPYSIPVAQGRRTPLDADAGQRAEIIGVSRPASRGSRWESGGLTAIRDR